MKGSATRPSKGQLRDLGNFINLKNFLSNNDIGVDNARNFHKSRDSACLSPWLRGF